MALEVRGEGAASCTVGVPELESIPRREQSSDFHCVTTWTAVGLRWSGWLFADVWRQLILPRCASAADCNFVVLKARDGYVTSLLLADLLHGDVLLADRLDGRPLDVAHGAPLRLIAPKHYGYKNVKHLSAIECHRARVPYRAAGFAFMDHPRARVAEEERGRGIPAVLLRSIYRPLVGSTIRRFAHALTKQAGT